MWHINILNAKHALFCLNPFMHWTLPLIPLSTQRYEFNMWRGINGELHSDRAIWWDVPWKGLARIVRNTSLSYGTSKWSFNLRHWYFVGRDTHWCQLHVILTFSFRATLPQRSLYFLKKGKINQSKNDVHQKSSRLRSFWNLSFVM